MSNKKRRNPFESMMRECSRTNKKIVLLVPALLVFIGIFTRWVSGSPISTLHFVGAKDVVPPVWLFVLLFCLSYIVAGFSLGLALGNQICIYGEKKYQGAMWFVISLAIGYTWYPIFVCARLFLVSAGMSALCLFCSICATMCFAGVSKASFFLSLLYDCWLLYLFLLNMKVFFAI
jgi:tryptophan-rich sensory protein